MIPKIVEIHAAAPSVLVAVAESSQDESGIGTAPDTLDLDPAHWQVNGQPPVAIHRDSMPWDEGKAKTATQPNTYPVTVRHRIYLHLAALLQDGTTYAVTGPYGSQSIVFGSRTTPCESIKVNQVGYSDRATSRWAVFGVYLGNGGSLRFSPFPGYQVIDEKTGNVVFSGTVAREFDDTAVSATAPTSGEWVYRLPLDTVPAGGPYFVSVPGCGRSRSFGIGQEYTRKAAYVATRGLYHQRCGIALESPYTEFTRGICHAKIADTRAQYPGNGFINVPSGAAMAPIRGGYHDAGDFQRRPTHTLIPLLMLSTYEAWPSHFIDRQYNLPESGNGIPDFLDEALWGLLLWENLQITTAGDPLQGGVRAGTQRDAEPTYGVHSAASDPGMYGTWAPLEETTAFACGMFAQASRLVRPFDSAHADALLNRARMAWAYLQRTTNVNQAATRFLYPALQLYLATGEQPFHDLFKAAAQAVVVVGAWPEQYLPGNTAANCLTVHFVSYLLPTDRAVDATLATALKSKILQGAASGGYMNVDTENSPYSQGVNKFYSWGAMTAQGRYAEVCAFATLFETDATKRQKYTNTVSQLADYALGLNPLGRSFYTGLGTDSPNSPGHCDSYFTKYGLSDGVTSDHVGKPIGNAPGILVFGPTAGASGQSYQTAVSKKLSPDWDALPIQRRYGDGWSLLNSNEFSTWETIAWNVMMLGFLHDASKDPASMTPPPTPAPQPGTGVQLTAAQTDALKRIIADLEILKSAIPAG